MRGINKVFLFIFMFLLFTGFSFAGIYYGSINNEPYEPKNNAIETGTRTIDFVFNASSDNNTHIENCSLLLNIYNSNTTNWSNWSINQTLKNEHDTSGIDDYCVGNYWFEGNTSDMSGNGNDGIIHGNVKNVSGLVGQAYDFDGVDSYITTSLTINLSNAFTLSWWQKAKEITPGNPFYRFSSYGSGNVKIESREDYNYGAYRFRYAGSGIGHVITTGVVNGGKWHHIVWTQTGGSTLDTFSIYVNGIERGTETIPVKKYADKNIDFGKFNGTIDEVLVFNRSLTSDEISAIYENLKIRQDGTNNTISVTFADDENEIDWKIQCYDNSSIPWNSSQMHLLIDIDTTPPIVNLEYPNNNADLEGKTHSLKYTPIDTNLKNCTLTLSKGTYSEKRFKDTPDLTNGTQVTELITGLDYGIYTWSIECYDYAHNKNIKNNHNFTTYESESDDGGSGDNSPEEKVYCKEDWLCGGWSICINGTQIRRCVDVNRCGSIGKKPIEKAKCGDSNKESNSSRIKLQPKNISKKETNEETEKDEEESNLGITGAIVGLFKTKASKVILIILGTIMALTILTGIVSYSFREMSYPLYRINRLNRVPKRLFRKIGGGIEFLVDYLEGTEEGEGLIE